VNQLIWLLTFFHCEEVSGKWDFCLIAELLTPGNTLCYIIALPLSCGSDRPLKAISKQNDGIDNGALDLLHKFITGFNSD
jgi:hypothetical protein